MHSKTTQDEGRLQLAQVSPTGFCDLHGPKRKESRDVFKSITCNFHCHDRTASALAQGKPARERVQQAPQVALGWSFPHHNHFAVFKHTRALARILAFYRHGVFLLTVT